MNWIGHFFGDRTTRFWIQFLLIRKDIKPILIKIAHYESIADPIFPTKPPGSLFLPSINSILANKRRGGRWIWEGIDIGQKWEGWFLARSIQTFAAFYSIIHSPKCPVINSIHRSSFPNTAAPLALITFSTNLIIFLFPSLAQKIPSLWTQYFSRILLRNLPH